MEAADTAWGGFAQDAVGAGGADDLWEEVSGDVGTSAPVFPKGEGRQDEAVGNAPPT